MNKQTIIDLSGKVALIVGGSRGIGAATAKMLAGAGATTVITYAHNRRKAEETAAAIRKGGGSCHLLPCRMEDPASCASVVRRTVELCRRLDILVNSGGIWEEGRVGKMNVRDWRKTIEINLTGTFTLCNAAVPVMKKERSGSIINISSTAGQRGEAFHSHYAASKGGVIAFTKSLAVEVARWGIRVNCVAPGWVETDMVRIPLSSRSERKEIIRGIPRGVVASPDDIAGPILFLASDLSKHLVGEILNVNGGSVLCG